MVKTDVSRHIPSSFIRKITLSIRQNEAILRLQLAVAVVTVKVMVRNAHIAGHLQINDNPGTVAYSLRALHAYI